LHHHTGNIGHVRNGNYGLITVTTRTTFADDVRFRTTMVTGTLEANTIAGNQLIVDNGTVRCSGDVHVERIAGRGRIITDGSIICGGIELTGDLHSGGDITCNDDLLVKGSLTSRHIRARNILLHGVLQGHRINGSSLEIRPLRSAMFTRFDMLKYEGGSSASHIDVNKIEAHRLTCRTLQAGTAILCDNSMVEHAICSTSIGLDRTSCVMLVNRECRRYHLKTA